MSLGRMVGAIDEQGQLTRWLKGQTRTLFISGKTIERTRSLGPETTPAWCRTHASPTNTLSRYYATPCERTTTHTTVATAEALEPPDLSTQTNFRQPSIRYEGGGRGPSRSISAVSSSGPEARLDRVQFHDFWEFFLVGCGRGARCWARGVQDFASLFRPFSAILCLHNFFSSFGVTKDFFGLYLRWCRYFIAFFIHSLPLRHHIPLVTGFETF